MAVLQDILYGVPLSGISGHTDIPVDDLSLDNRQVKIGSMFAAMKGTRVDGHQYIDKAIENGAVAVLCEDMPQNLKDSVTYIQVQNTPHALGIIASNFYDNPSHKLKLTGITGTNGKTTIATLLYQLFQNLGYQAGLISTIDVKTGEQSTTASMTTPDAIEINRMLADMVEAGCTHAFMEVSSHAIVQERTAGLRFVGAVFTNITHDHLDYHGTFENYIYAKKKLFDNLPKEAFALVNYDDKRGKVMVQNTEARVFSYALKAPSDFKGKVLANSLYGLELQIQDPESEQTTTWFKLLGDFNAYNLLATYGVAFLLNEDPNELLAAMSMLGPASGRLEQVIVPNSPQAIVDYAHTPDALKNVLKTITGVRTKNETLFCVIGCGGNRDKEKRPKMAEIAVKYCDKVILTSDNPRDEDPEEILEEMMQGVPALHYKKTMKITDRREAIKTACLMAGKEDIILVAGKGHETYQEVKGQRSSFDDREVLKEMLNMASE